MYGTRMVTGNEDSPHLLADKLRGELYRGFAENDIHVPQSDVDQLGEIMNGCQGSSLIEQRPGTVYAFQFPGRGEAYHKEAAERSWERKFANFQRQLKPGN